MSKDVQDRSISHTYPRSYEAWPEGFLCGDGALGAIVFGAPLSETVILNHRKFFIAATHERSFRKVSEKDLTDIRKACLSHDFKRANDLANEVHGWQDGGEGNKHPGFALCFDIASAGDVREYRRELSFETGIIHISFDTSEGHWERDSFLSRKDHVYVQRILPPSGKVLDEVTLRLDIHEGMHFPEGMSFKKEAGEEHLSVHACYPHPELTGNAGYDGACRICVKGNDSSITVQGNQITAHSASEILLLVAVDRFDDPGHTGWGSKQLEQRLDDLPADYELLKARHIPLHQELFSTMSVKLSTEVTDEDNETLLARQKESTMLIPALYERLFYAGRYHLICCCNETAAPDLLGLWTGDCNVGWNGYYHLDANLNLQISGITIGNMPSLIQGYQYLMEHWAEGFRRNAADLLGCRGMLGGGNTPGTSSGLISALNFDYPYQYVTGEMAWLIYPLWEYAVATNDLPMITSVVYPWLREMDDFYQDFLREKDSEGHYVFAGSISPENKPLGLELSLVNNSVFDIEGCRWIYRRLTDCAERYSCSYRPDEYEHWQAMLSALPAYRINEDGSLAEWADAGLNDNFSHRHSSGLIGVWPYREIRESKDPSLYKAAIGTLQSKDRYVYEDAGHGLLHAALIATVLHQKKSMEEKLYRFGHDDFYYSGLGTAHYPDHKVFCTDVAHTLPTIIMEMLIGSDEASVDLLPAVPDAFSRGEGHGWLTRCGVIVQDLFWDLEASVSVTFFSERDRTFRFAMTLAFESMSTDAAAIRQIDQHTWEITLRKDQCVTVNFMLSPDRSPQIAKKER